MLASLVAIFGPSDSLSNDQGWFTRAFGLPTHAGPVVNEQTALELPVVYSAIGIIADAVAQLPVVVGKKTGDKREVLPDHPLMRVMNVRANPWMSAFTQRQTSLSHCLGWGNGYTEVQRDAGGRVVALWPLLPDRTWPEARDDKIEFRTHVGGKQFLIPHERVLHVPAMGFDGLIGYSPIQLARQAIGLGKATEEYGSKFFANESKSGGFFTHPGQLGSTALENLRSSLGEDGQGGLTNAHRVKILEEGMQFLATTIPPEDAQFLQTRQHQVEEVARLYRVPLFMLQSAMKNTAWGTGLSEMSLGFLIYTLMPWINRTEQEYTEKLLTPQERAAGLFIKLNPAGLLRSDIKSRGEWYTKALNPVTGWMNRNEARTREDLNPEDEVEDVEVVT